ncbi:MAG: pentapeptide repeat-containing protein, partial [Aestuariivita sp.]|uniref:pentapeptide repeat-containing protein n=1 Tax=Aestuariivita sp. TaxID=1872407 RepID=UPI003BB08574
QGASLIRAQLQGADLWDAQLQGADLDWAQLQGAGLSWAEMDEETDLRSASLRGARLRYVDYTQVGLTQEHVDSVFGDDTVALPEGITPPERFSRAHEGREAFEAAWRAWQTEIGFDRDDPSTWGQ